MQYLICDDHDNCYSAAQGETVGYALILAYCFSIEWDSEVQIYKVHTRDEKKKLQYMCSVDAS